MMSKKPLLHCLAVAAFATALGLSAPRSTAAERLAATLEQPLVWIARASAGCHPVPGGYAVCTGQPPRATTSLDEGCGIDPNGHPVCVKKARPSTPQ